MTRFDLLSHKFLIGATCFGVIAALALFGGALSPYDGNAQDLLAALDPPGLGNGAHLLGTDQLGRDIFARMVSGARISLTIAAAVVVISGIVGTLVGAVSGYWGGLRDVALQKLVETFWAFPPILLALTIMALFGQSLVNVVLAIAVQRWIPYCRIARAQALVLATKDFIAAARMMGGGMGWIVFRHLLPNILSAAVVIATFSMATSILAEASLSFLGLGVPPDIASWGGMLAEGRSYITEAWWIAVFPGLGIVLTVLGLNLLGDWLRDQLDPKKTINLR